MYLCDKKTFLYVILKKSEWTFVDISDLILLNKK